MSCSISMRMICCEESRLAESGGDASIFDTPELEDRRVGGGERAQDAGEGGLERRVTNNRIGKGSDLDTHIHKVERG